MTEKELVLILEFCIMIVIRIQPFPIVIYIRNEGSTTIDVLKNIHTYLFNHKKRRIDSCFEVFEQLKRIRNKF